MDKEEIEITETTKRTIRRIDLMNQRGQLEYEITRLQIEITKIDEQLKLFKS
jgi:hypothetical protein